MTKGNEPAVVSAQYNASINLAIELAQGKHREEVYTNIIQERLEQSVNSAKILS